MWVVGQDPECSNGEESTKSSLQYEKPLPAIDIWSVRTRMTYCCKGYLPCDACKARHSTEDASGNKPTESLRKDEPRV
jgi:hypothetical protein